MMQQTSPSQAPAVIQETLLLDYARRIERHPGGRRAVQVHLSKLRPYNRREHHLRIARATFENLLSTYDGQHFLLANADLVFVCKGAAIADIEPAIAKLRFLFAEDPIARAPSAGDADRFCTWFDIERDHRTFLVAAESLALEEQRQRSLAGVQPKRPDLGLAPLAIAQFGAILEALTRADMTKLIRRQAVCALLPGAKPHPVFNEVYISIADLQRMLAPKTNLASSRWLFRYLTDRLDKRMLATLRGASDPTLAARFSLNLNLETLLSSDFVEFDAHVPNTARGTLIVEIQFVDIVADLGTYFLARDMLRARGYKICLDGLTPATAAFANREQLDMDLLKIIWSPDMVDGAPGHGLDTTLIKRNGEARVILCRCDSEAAIRVGQAAGVSLFQGRHVDALLAAKSGAAAAKSATG